MRPLCRLPRKSFVSIISESNSSSPCTKFFTLKANAFTLFMCPLNSLGGLHCRIPVLVHVVIVLHILEFSEDRCPFYEKNLSVIHHEEIALCMKPYS